MQNTNQHDRRIWLFRVLGVITAVNVPMFRVMLDPLAYDPMWIRWAICGLVLFFCGLSFYRGVGPRFWPVVVSVFANILTLWMLWLAYMNRLHPQYTTSYIVLLIAGLVTNHRTLPLFLLSFLNLSALTAAVLLVRDPVFPPSLFWGMSGSLVLVIATVLRFNIREWTTLEDKQEWTSMVNEAAFAFSDDGILVTAQDGRVLAFNQQLRVMWGLDDDEIKVGEHRSGVDKIRPMIENVDVFEESHRRTQVNLTMELTDELVLKDGRHIARVSRPIAHHGQLGARIWFFRDVTRQRLDAKRAEESRRKLRQQNDELIALAGSEAFRQGLVDEAYLLAARTANRVLGTTQTGVWEFTEDQKAMTCDKMVRGDGELVARTFRVERRQSPGYFDALRSERVIAIPNTSMNPLTAPFVGMTGSQLHGALDVPVRHNGEVVAVICTEQDGVRHWGDDEQAFLSALGDMLAQALQARDRKLAEAEMRKALGVLKTVFQQGGIGVLITGNAQEVLDYNDKYLELWGMSAQFLLERSSDEVVAFCRAQVLQGADIQQFQGFLDQPEQEGYDLLFLRNGKVLERQTSPVGDGDVIFGRAWIYRDITDRMNAEQRLRESEQENKFIVSALPHIILTLSGDGMILDYRIPAQNTFGSFADRLGKRHISEVLPQDCIACATNAIQSLDVVGDTTNHDMQVPLPEGMLYLEARMVKSGPSEFLLFIRNVTEKKLAETELLQRNFELDSFVYRASHDLKAPLNSLMGIVSILQSENDDPKLQRFLAMMDKSLVKLDTFIRNLNDFVRIARTELKTTDLLLRPMVKEIIEELQHMDDAKGVHFVVDVGEDARVQADAFNLGIVLSNLISNAIKYQDRGKAEQRVEVRLSRVDGVSCIEVADNGLGVAPEFQERIFELFFRASNQSFGSGLGLYITRNAVQKMGGHIEMVSRLGEGTRFRVLLGS